MAGLKSFLQVKPLLYEGVDVERCELNLATKALPLIENMLKRLTLGEQLQREINSL